MDAPNGILAPVRAKPPAALSAWERLTSMPTRMGTFRGEVTDYEPPARFGFPEPLRWFSSDLMEPRPEYTLEADRNKTIVHHVAEGELFGIMRLMKPVAARLARSERARTVESLRRSLESD